jgi:3',5'-cyclic AMP phosphodiesterase CpdA
MNKKKTSAIATSVSGLLLIITLLGCKTTPTLNTSDSFSFVFLTDVHLQPEKGAMKGFVMAIGNINALKPDFVITGGDLIMDALEQTYSRADSLYDLYQTICKDFAMPVYNTLGNHDIYGIYEGSGADPSDPEYGEKMFENRLGKTYYAFDHKGWKFMVLNSVEDTKRNEYVGMIDSLQLEWIKKELAATDTTTPIVLSTHIPFITAFTQRYRGSTLPNDSSLVVVNSKQVLDLFNHHNLKLVLQGHLHIVEDVLVDGVHYLTGGAISGGWWTGPNRGFEEGFMYLAVKGDSISWQYVDYGWQVK